MPDKFIFDDDDGEFLYDEADGQSIYDENDPPDAPSRPGVAEALIFDEDDGEYIFDEHDGEYIFDENDTVLPIIEGALDPVGGALGGPSASRVYLIDTPALSLGASESVPADAAWRAIANHPIAGDMLPIPAVGPGLTPVDFRLASTDFVSRHDDTVEPSQYWDGRVIDPGSISLSLPLVTVGDAAISANLGQIVIDNTDAALDTILDNNLAISQTIEIKGGVKGADLGTFVTLCVARITGIGMNRSQLTIDVSDPATYAQNLYPTTVYAGTGGMSGTEEMEGTVKPVVIGRVWNMAPVLIDPVLLVYQVHDGEIAAVSGVFDGGVPLTFSADYGSYGALIGATIAPGGYATCLSGGLIRVGGSPIFAITAHVDGHAAAGVSIRSISTWLAGIIENDLEIDVDISSFQALPVHLAGWIWQDEFRLSDALSRFVGDAGYSWGADVSGPIIARRLDPPSPASIQRRLGTADIMEIERVALPDGFDGVHHRRIVRYAKNWTVQQGQLATTAVNKALRQREWKTAMATRSTGSRNAIDPPVLDTSLGSKAGASALAERFLDLHGTYRRMYAIDMKIFGTPPKLGSTIHVTHPRFGLASGDIFRVVDMDLRLSESAARLLVWG